MLWKTYFRHAAKLNGQSTSEEENSHSYHTWSLQEILKASNRRVFYSCFILALIKECHSFSFWTNLICFHMANHKFNTKDKSLHLTSWVVFFSTNMKFKKNKKGIFVSIGWSWCSYQCLKIVNKIYILRSDNISYFLYSAWKYIFILV